MGKIVLSCVLALVFGFGGAAGAVSAFEDQFQGPQGPTGLSGAPGPAGRDGVDGEDGARGPRGLPGTAGKAGKAGKAAQKPSAPVTDLGVGDCAGDSVSVITSATLGEDQKLKLTKKDVCIVTPPATDSTE